ncbi:MAG: hypothetical protein NTV21_05290 [Planctomycetota bacterium]|nr:hypothetical protein [Planctomycetota bacterium]
MVGRHIRAGIWLGLAALAGCANGPEFDVEQVLTRGEQACERRYGLEARQHFESVLEVGCESQQQMRRLVLGLAKSYQLCNEPGKLAALATCQEVSSLEAADCLLVATDLQDWYGYAALRFCDAGLVKRGADENVDRALEALSAKLELNRQRGFDLPALLPLCSY